MNEKIIERKICRICDSRDFAEVINLGLMPVSNAFLTEEELNSKEETFPLAVHICKNCKSLQLKHLVSPKLIFENYHYATGASRPLVEHFNGLAQEISKNYVQTPLDLVIEIGSNDGSLLSKIDKGRVLGIDPAENIASIAIEKGIPTKVGFFDSHFSKKLKDESGEAKVIVANNVMAHIDDIKDVFKGVKNLLTEDGVFIFEVHWVGNLLTEGGFDQIYHEHIYYHSLHSLKILVNSLGMVIKDICSVPIHGESMRLYVGRSGKESDGVVKFLKREKENGLTEINTYMKFNKKVELLKREISELLKKIKSQGKKIIGYGAPAKGNTLLNYFEIGPSILDYIVDTTIYKQGLYTPGSHVLIVNPDILKKEIPDYALLLSWNYAQAILDKEKELRAKGTKFIIPVPRVRVI